MPDLSRYDGRKPEPPYPTEPEERQPIAHYCEHKLKCQWQCFALHQGFAWGLPEGHLHAWRQRHDEVCGGRLLPLYAD